MSENIIPYGLKKNAFLAAFRGTGNVCLACEAADVGRSSHYRWLETDLAYREAFGSAKEDAADILEAEAKRRAVDGIEEFVGWYKGEPGGVVRKYSDTLLIFLLKGLKPEVYRERVEVSGTLSKIDFSRMTDEQLSRIAAGEHPWTVLAPSRDLFEPEAGEPPVKGEMLMLPAATDGAEE